MNLIKLLRGLLLAGFVVFPFGARAQPAAPSAELAMPAVPSDETSEQHTARMKWWREARFGLFIHWGIYSVPAGVHQGKEMGPRIGEWI